MNRSVVKQAVHTLHYLAEPALVLLIPEPCNVVLMLAATVIELVTKKT